MRRLLNLLLHPFPAAILAISLSILLFNAFPADSIMYHLPFTARFLNLPGFPDFTGYFEGRYQGFPSLWRILLGPGLAWNHPRLFIVPNLLALGLLAYCCRKLLGLSAALAICCCFTFPVALLGFRSSLQDFFVGVLVTIASITLFQVSYGFDRELRKPRWISRWDLLGLTCLALAANVKFQGLFMAMLVLTAALIFRFRDLNRNGWIALPARKSQLAVATILSMLVFLQPALNTSRFGNPFYPVSVAGFNGTEPPTSAPIQYIPQIPLLKNAASYIVSALEIDPIIRSKAGWSFNRTWHNHNLPKPQYQPIYPDYQWILTGGSNGLLFLLLFFGAFMSVYGWWREAPLPLTPLLILRRRLLNTSLLFMFMPQSMELRYYLISLFVPALVAVSGDATILRQVMRWAVVVGLWFTLILTFIQPIYFWTRTGDWMIARGQLSPDPYRRLPSVQQCVEQRRLWGGLISTASDRKIDEVKASMSCHLRLTQP